MSKVEKETLIKRGKLIAVAAVTLCIIVFFILALFSYLNSFSNALVEENSDYLSEITNHIAVNAKIVVDDMQKTMDSAGMAISVMEKEQERTAYLKSLKEKYDFEYVGYADLHGELIATLQPEQKNISTESYFQESMRGESTVHYIPVKIFTDKAVSGLLLSSPVYELTGSRDQPIGVLVALLDMKKFGDSLNIAGYNGQGATYIIGKTGDIVLNTKRLDYSNLYAALSYANFEDTYSIEQVISDLKQQGSGFAIYTNFGIEKYMYYQYLGIDSWSIVSVIEKNVITEKTTQITKELMTVGIIVMIIFPLLLIFAVSSMEMSKNSRQAANAKTAFLANMSHEIRTPMNAIVGISEILLRENISDKQKNYVLSIVNAGNGLLTIINDILDISKMESGKFSIVDEEYELESLIYDIITIVAIKIGDKPIEFMVDLDPELPKYVVGDMIRVKQVLLNIIGNAVKFTKSGYIKFRVYSEIVDGQLELSMTIEDTGIGIQKKDIGKLFESFSQVDTHKNHALEGTGLGLVISKKLCEKMGGGITVESEYESGSTFTVQMKQSLTREEKMMPSIKPESYKIILLETSECLRQHFASCMSRMALNFEICKDYDTFEEKLAAGGYTHAIVNTQVFHRIINEGNTKKDVQYIVLLHLREQAKMEDYRLSIIVPLFTMQLSAALANLQGHLYLQKRTGIDVLTIQPMPFVRILLVDDNEVNLQVANGLMSPYHMQVDCALSGKSAIAMIQRSTYDLVFMDHMMPEMDGVEAVKIIRSLPNEQHKSVPIIALTANVTHDAKALFMASGFDDFLSKPIETIKLNVILKKWLKDKNEERSAQNPEAAETFRRKLAEEEHRDLVKTISKQFGNKDYVDFAKGVEMLGSREVYSNILKTYCRSAEEKLDSLPVLLEHDLANFTIEIHGLKGASGGVMAGFIAKAAAEMENLAKENSVEQIKTELPEFITALEATLAEIRLFLEQDIDKDAPPQTAKQKERKPGPIPPQLLLSMKDAFMDFDTEKLKDLFAEQENFAFDEREETLFLKLKNCCNSYNFELPVQLIEEYEQTNLNGEMGVL